jgi:hypothetical protein
MDIFATNLESAINKAESIIPVSIRKNIVMFEQVAKQGNDDD